MLLKHVIPSIIWKNPRYGTTGIVCFEKTTCTRSKYFFSYICIKSEGPAYFVRTQKDLTINKKYSTSHHIPNWILKTRTYVCIVTNFFFTKKNSGVPLNTRNGLSAVPYQSKSRDSSITLGSAKSHFLYHLTIEFQISLEVLNFPPSPYYYYY